MTLSFIWIPCPNKMSLRILSLWIWLVGWPETSLALRSVVLYPAITQNLVSSPEVMSMLWDNKGLCSFYPTCDPSHPYPWRGGWPFSSRQSVWSRREVCIFCKCHFKTSKGRSRGRAGSDLLDLITGIVSGQSPRDQPLDERDFRLAWCWFCMN